MASPSIDPLPHDADDTTRAARVARTVTWAAARSHVGLGDDLRIWSLAGGRPDLPPGDAVSASDGLPPGGAPPDRHDRDGHPGDADADAAGMLGAALEAATPRDRRRSQGLHVTPRWLAERLVGRALPGAAPSGGESGPTVCDPACGGGAFLVAAARHLHRLGIDRRSVVRHMLWGADVDAVGLAAAEAALALWAGEAPPPGRLVVADPLRHRGPVWPEAPAAGFAAVVGNPPFQNQLGRPTARSTGERRALRARFGGAVRAYTDTAWLFLLLGCEVVRPGGRVVLVQPQSLVAARDAAAVRAAVDDLAHLHDLWVDDDRVFAAAVRVCAPVLERRDDRPPAAAAPARGSGARDGSGGASWGRLWADAVGLPDVQLAPGPRLGDRATVVAGFRDQYYGLVDVVREATPSDTSGRVAPLVTSGAIDWAACSWGERPIRYAKRRWQAPVVDLERLPAAAPPIARRWVERSRTPKLVVATQTRVVEAAVDCDGDWVPSVPTLAVLPADDGDLWRLAAALLAPAATAWLLRRSAGNGLERGTLKVAAPDLAALPLPGDATAWDAATARLRSHVAEPRVASLDGYLAAAAAAYGTPTALTRWWRARAGAVVRCGSAGG